MGNERFKLENNKNQIKRLSLKKTLMIFNFVAQNQQLFLFYNETVNTGEFVNKFRQTGIN